MFKKCYIWKKFNKDTNQYEFNHISYIDDGDKPKSDYPDVQKQWNSQKWRKEEKIAIKWYSSLYNKRIPIITNKKFKSIIKIIFNGMYYKIKNGFKK